MALEQITFNIGAFNDSDAGGNNYFANTVFEVKNQSDGTFATIYADSSGATQIPQNGIDNISNSRGECIFYIGGGDFYIEVNSKKKFFKTGWSSQSRQSIEAIYKAQGYNNVFFFEDGFTYTEANDVGVYSDGTAWTYADAGALPVTIAAGTVPSEPDYFQVSVNSADNIFNDDGSTAQDTYLELKGVKVKTDELSLRNSPNNDFAEQWLLTGNNVPSKAYSIELPYKYDGEGNEFISALANPPSVYVPIIREDCPSVCIEEIEGLVLIITPSYSEAGYLVYSLVNNLTTAAESIATTASDITSYRLNRVQHAVYSCVGFNTYSSSTGSWSEIPMMQVDPSMPDFTNSRNYIFQQSYSNSSASITYNSVQVIDGVIKVTFASTAASNPATLITVDGVSYTVDLTQAVGEFLTFTFPVTSKKNVSVTIENNSAGNFYFCNFLGFWFSELKYYNGEATVDKFGYYRDTNKWSEYSTTTASSDNDFVLREYKSDTYGCGYHGGESNIVNTFKADGVEFTPSSAPVATKRLTVETNSTVDWRVVGGDAVIQLNKCFYFNIGGYTSEVGFSGEIIANQEYSALFGVSTDFSEILSPNYKLISNTPDGDRLRLGKHSSVVYRNPTTGQKVKFNLTMHRDDNGNQYGGVYVWRIDTNYHKLYYNKVHNGRLTMDGGYRVNRVEFM